MKTTWKLETLRAKFSPWEARDWENEQIKRFQNLTDIPKWTCWHERNEAQFVPTWDGVEGEERPKLQARILEFLKTNYYGFTFLDIWQEVGSPPICVISACRDLVDRELAIPVTGRMQDYCVGIRVRK